MKTTQNKIKIMAAAVVFLGMSAGLQSFATKGHFSSKAKSTAKRADISNVKNKNISFGFNRAAITADYYAELAKVATLMQQNNAAVKLSGHADNVGGYVYNWKLSEARAQAVKDYLIGKGIDSSRVAATGFGDTKPIASNKTQTGRLKNRRVEIKFAQ
ncbi:OmpA family protein [Mucilaginibacter ginkgonis]|uniref:OmpA family protein n=1 Tax=Mucilaginibacter ginkgonis TaxID=2682091 RepID=A0A6I4I157_9SPHI|nr:OmpA family protein [Mucilaginibacter ginkgonis]QQL51230.1 OmpA family protein [Mucilaginibacter ginkgonis]